MTLEEYLYKSYCLRNRIENEEEKTINKIEYNGHIRTEFAYLKRRLSLLFGIEPDFLLHPHIVTKCKVKKVTEDGLFFQKEWDNILTPNDDIQKIAQAIEEYTEEIYKILSIYWYIVTLHIGEFHNDPQIYKGKKLIEKTANKSFANSKQRRKMYDDYFEKIGSSLSHILICISSMEEPYNVPALPIFTCEHMSSNDVLRYIDSNEFLCDLRNLTEKAIMGFEKSIAKEEDKSNQIMFDGGVVSPHQIYMCDINEDEETLFDLLGDIIEINRKEIFDKIRNAEDWTIIEEEDRKRIVYLIYKIYNRKDIDRINRYVRSKTLSEVEDRLKSIKEKLLFPIYFSTCNKTIRLYDILINYNIETEDLLKCEKALDQALKVLKAYEKEIEN